MPTDPGTSTGRIAGWLSSWASVIAPVTVVSTLLFYFGYVASRAQYDYFGIDVDVVGLGTRDYVMRSPQPLLVPLLTLALVGAALLSGHVRLRQRISRALAAVTVTVDGDGDGDAPRRTAARVTLRRLRRGARGAVFVGFTLLGAGILLLFGYSALRDWSWYDFITPATTALGGALVGYGSHLIETTGRAPLRIAPATPSSGDRTDDRRSDVTTLPRRSARILLFALTAVSLFWVTATVAQWSGRDLARDTALHLDQLPRVILDTREPLYLHSPGVTETLLPPSEGQTYRYRYRQLRLLVMGRDHMFLVPERWSASNSTLVVPLDDSVRIQFQFVNDQP